MEILQEIQHANNKEETGRLSKWFVCPPTGDAGTPCLAWQPNRHCREVSVFTFFFQRFWHQQKTYKNSKAIDFWLVRQPAFLETNELSAINSQLPKPAAAVVSTDPTFITFLKLRLEYVLEGSFEAPSAAIPDALASTAA